MQFGTRQKYWNGTKYFLVPQAWRESFIWRFRFIEIYPAFLEPSVHNSFSFFFFFSCCTDACVFSHWILNERLEFVLQQRPQVLEGMFAIRNADGMGKGKKQKKTSWSDINKRWSERPWLITSNIPTFNFIQIKRCCVSPDVCLTENHLISLVREEKNKYKKKSPPPSKSNSLSPPMEGIWCVYVWPNWHVGGNMWAATLTRIFFLSWIGFIFKTWGEKKFPYMECVNGSVAHCEVSPDNVVIIITQRRRRERKRRWRTVFHQRSPA